MALKSKKLIQIPMGMELINDLVKLSEETGESRAEIVRKACYNYINMVKVKKMENVYVEGYKKMPEDEIMSHISTELFMQITSREEW